MICNTALQAAFSKTCHLCHRMIGYGDYDTIKKKSHTYGKINYPSKTLYVHRECYNKEYNMHLPLYYQK